MNDLLEDIVVARNLLSISSHVVHGSVGNDAMQFPLNLRNWNVDCIYTTNLSTHPGHGKFTGVPVDSSLIKTLYDGLCDINFDKEYEVVIIGYVASSKILETVWENVLKRMDLNSNIIKVIDPVMGDNEKIYVKQDIVDLYLDILSRNEISIDLLTPNQFEMEILTGIKIKSWDSILEAIKFFNLKYSQIKNVIITSVIIFGKMYCVGCSKGKIFYFKVSEINAIYSGSGDLFLGILTDEFIRNEGDLQVSLGKTIKKVEKVLQLSYYLSKDDVSLKKINDKVYIPDLKLIESKHILTDNFEIPELFYVEG